MIAKLVFQIWFYLRKNAKQEKVLENDCQLVTKNENVFANLTQVVRTHKNPVFKNNLLNF